MSIAYIILGKIYCFSIVRPSIVIKKTKTISAGDTNLLTNLLVLCVSGVIEYLSSGKVAGNHCDFKELGYEVCLQTFNCNKDGTQLTHNFKLSRAYENEDMTHTNYT